MRSVRGRTLGLSGPVAQSEGRNGGQRVKEWRAHRPVHTAQSLCRAPMPKERLPEAILPQQWGQVPTNPAAVFEEAAYVDVRALSMN